MSLYTLLNNIISKLSDQKKTIVGEDGSLSSIENLTGTLADLGKALPVYYYYEKTYPFSSRATSNYLKSHYWRQGHIVTHTMDMQLNPGTTHFILSDNGGDVCPEGWRPTTTVSTNTCSVVGSKINSSCGTLQINSDGKKEMWIDSTSYVEWKCSFTWYTAQEYPNDSYIVG